MIQTFQAFLVLLVAVLPGAVYTIARESRGATWAWRQSDAGTLVFRFLCASAVYHALLAPLTYHAYRQLIHSHALAEGRSLSWWWWGVLLAYVFVPFAGGILTEKGRNWRGSTCWAKKAVSLVVSLYAGSSPEPRAWDWFFDKRPTGIVRMKLTNGEWKAGLFDRDSFASGYGEEGDIYLANEYLVDEDGVLLDDGKSGYQSAGVDLLIRWSEVHYLEFSEWPQTAHDSTSESGAIDG